MSRQLAISAAASTFALAAMALLAPGSARVSELPAKMGATMSVAAPMVSSAPQVFFGADLLSLID